VADPSHLPGGGLTGPPRTGRHGRRGALPTRHGAGDAAIDEKKVQRAGRQPRCLAANGRDDLDLR
jgi:hypothetical protein